MHIRPRIIFTAFLLLVASGAAARSLSAQGKSKHGGHVPPGHAKKVVSADDAVIVTREVLVRHGYEVVRIERVSYGRVVYYRRGNMGRGRGKGPVVKMIVRSSPERVVFEAAPRGVLIDINVRLGL